MTLPTLVRRYCAPVAGRIASEIPLKAQEPTRALQALGKTPKVTSRGFILCTNPTHKTENPCTRRKQRKIPDRRWARME